MTLDIVAGAALVVGGTFMGETAEPGQSSWTGLPNDFEQKGLAITMASVGVIALASAVYGYDVANRCEQINSNLAREQAQRDAMIAQRNKAWTLTQQAADAARAGDCEKVLALDGQVRATDAEFHTVVFRRDAAIVRCLTAQR